MNGCVGNDNNGYTKEEIELSATTAKSEVTTSKEIKSPSTKMSSNKIVSKEVGSNEIGSREVIYKSYSQRWWLLASVALLNIANYAHWISFASVNSKAAVFYQVKNKQLSFKKSHF